MTGARQAALLLHGLSPQVRRHVIARLDAAEKSRLEPLLAELVELGVPSSLGRQNDSSLPSALAGESADSSDPCEGAARLDAERVAQSLQDCAAITVAQLLRCGDWPWKQRVLELMPEMRRAEVRQHLRREASVLAPAVVRGLCEQLCSAAARQASPPGHVQRPAAPATLGTRIRRLFAWTR
jgi:hypothetical protein